MDVVSPFEGISWSDPNQPRHTNKGTQNLRSNYSRPANFKPGAQCIVRAPRGESAPSADDMTEIEVGS
jgi:hypothetical protein